MTLSLGRVVLFVASTIGSAAAQQVWKVNCNGGPGVHFTDLPPAVAAAAPGDTILLYNHQPVCKTMYAAATIDKPLRLVGFSTAFPPGYPTPSVAAVEGVMTITGIPAGQQVLISNLNMFHSPPLSPASGLVVTNCQGDVVIEDLLYWNLGFASQLLRIQSCANVVLRGCEFALGGAPIEIIDSTVLLTTTQAWHWPPSTGSNHYTQTAEALNLTNSTVTVVGSHVRGSDEWAPWPSTLLQQPGVVMHGSMLRVGPASLVSGGARPGSTPGT